MREVGKEERDGGGEEGKGGKEEGREWKDAWHEGKGSVTVRGREVWGRGRVRGATKITFCSRSLYRQEERSW